MAGKGQAIKRIKNELNEDLAQRMQDEKYNKAKNQTSIQFLDKVVIGHYGNRYLNGNKKLLILQALGFFFYSSSK